MNIQRDISLAPRTTFQLGGSARFFATPESTSEFQEIIKQFKELPIFVLGGGSNTLVWDNGFDGLVISTERMKAFETKEENGELIIEAKAGVTLDDLCAFSVRMNFGGMEALSGIPGSLGGAIVQNAGAYGQETREIIEEVRAFNRNGALHTFSCGECAFGYRDSLFKHSEYFIESARLKLKKYDPQTLHPRAIIGETASEIRESVLSTRAQKGLCRIENGQLYYPRCAGSYFKNPVISNEKAAELLEQNPKMPHYSTELPDFTKFSAAWLIEHAGFPKGYPTQNNVPGEGRVGLLAQHTLVIENRGHAKSADIIDFSEHIASGVAQKFGVQLEPEPVFLSSAAKSL